MQPKDLVIVYKGPDDIDMIQLESEPKKGIYNCKFGSFPHSIFLGKPYGIQIWSADHKGFVYALRPTSQLLTESLAHRTQIIYATDISFIVSSLELHNGAVVIESGTGSGSLSVSLARAVAPKGHLYTFEYNAMRAKQAGEDFKKYGLESAITVTCRDAVKDGFMLGPETAGIADAVFLDLPTPWGAIPHAAKVLKTYGKLCNFSPCIEQVQRCAEAMTQNGFIEIETYECLSRHFEAESVEMKTLVPASRAAVVAEESKPKKEEEKKAEEGEKARKMAKGKRGTEDWGDRTKVSAAKSFHSERGHTGYLTVATYSGPVVASTASVAPAATTA